MTRRTLVAGSLVLALSLAGCAGEAAPDGPASETVEITDAWVKAADEGMTAGFGVLANSGAEATVVSAESDVAGSLELHETVASETGEMLMQEVAGGFVLPEGGELSLEPGGSHLMFMDLAEPLRPGDEVEVTLTFSDESTFTFSAPVKDYSGANENYGGSEEQEHGEHEEGEHAEHEHGGDGQGGSASDDRRGQTTGARSEPR
ncbi:copper chaperone PCu(A)C [Microbacterium sp. gxy059]|uniref:copper chaperone PCu(A)C n=1 Tax=Microbacterium sp. gxy059 TaxID=2957199 RepID=UPI003D99C004